MYAHGNAIAASTCACSNDHKKGIIQRGVLDTTYDLKIKPSVPMLYISQSILSDGDGDGDMSTGTLSSCNYLLYAKLKTWLQTKG